MKTKIKERGLSVEIDRQQMALELKMWRLRVGLTQAQVAERWGTHRWAILHIENAHPVSWMTAYRVWNHLAKELRKEVSDGRVED